VRIKLTFVIFSAGFSVLFVPGVVIFGDSVAGCDLSSPYCDERSKKPNLLGQNAE